MYPTDFQIIVPQNPSKMMQLLISREMNIVLYYVHDDIGNLIYKRRPFSQKIQYFSKK